MTVNPVTSVGYPVLRSVAGLVATHASQANQSMQKISSGLRLVYAADAPADMAMSERLRALIRREDAAAANIENAVSYTQTSDSFMQNIQDTLGRMQELAVAANDGAKTDTDRQALQTEFSQLQQSITDVASGDSPMASFNGQPVLQGGSMSVAIGPESGQSFGLAPVDLSNRSTAEIGPSSGGGRVTWASVLASGMGGTGIGTQGDAAKAVETLGLANDHISQLRAVRGAEQERLTQTLSGLRDSTVNTLTAESRLRNVDVARELVNLVKFQTLARIGQGVIHANTGNLLGVG
jgi:flagellin